MSARPKVKGPSKANAIRLLVCLLMSLVLVPLRAEAVRQTNLLVVTANLQQAYDKQDRSEMDVFVNRLHNQVRRAPDVVLAQEVNHESARYVAGALTREFAPERYRVAIGPPPGWPTQWTKCCVIQTETAILVNAGTVEDINGGYIKTSFPKWAAARGKTPQTKKNAFLVARDGSGERWAFSSVHFSPRGSMRTAKIDSKFRRRWTAKVARFLFTYFPRSHKVIGGDFNDVRCVTRPPNCRVSSFWDEMRDRRYKDVVFSVGKGSNSVDYIFTKERAIAGGADYDYDGSPFYSDHPFRWGVVGY